MNIEQLIKLADLLDARGEYIEAAKIDAYLRKCAEPSESRQEEYRKYTNTVNLSHIKDAIEHLKSTFDLNNRVPEEFEGLRQELLRNISNVVIFIDKYVAESPDYKHLPTNPTDYSYGGVMDWNVYPYVDND